MQNRTLKRWTLALLACALGAAEAVLVAGDGRANETLAAQIGRSTVVIVPNSPEGNAALSFSGVRVVARYEAFTLVEATGKAVIKRLVAAGGEVRDDMRRVRVGTLTFDPTRRGPARPGENRPGHADGRQGRLWNGPGPVCRSAEARMGRGGASDRRRYRHLHGAERAACGRRSGSACGGLAARRQPGLYPCGHSLQRHRQDAAGPAACRNAQGCDLDGRREGRRRIARGDRAPLHTERARRSGRRHRPASGDDGCRQGRRSRRARRRGRDRVGGRAEAA